MQISFDKDYVLNVATTAANMMDGMQLNNSDDRWDNVAKVNEAQGRGFLEFTQYIAELAMYSEDKLRERNPQDFPGIYDYEVSCKFGREYADYMITYGREPDDAELKRWIDILADTFFSQDE